MNTQIQAMEWERLAEQGRWVTCVELQRRFGPYMDTRGNVVIEVTVVPNLILWAGLSQEFADIIMGLVNQRRLWLHSASWLTYFIDGGVLPLPVPRRFSPKGYKRQHWLPVCLRVVPPHGGDGERPSRRVGALQGPQQQRERTETA